MSFIHCFERWNIHQDDSNDIEMFSWCIRYIDNSLIAFVHLFSRANIDRLKLGHG